MKARVLPSASVAASICPSAPASRVRIVQADYYLTVARNGVNDRQNNLLLAAGIVYRCPATTSRRTQVDEIERPDFAKFWPSKIALTLSWPRTTRHRRHRMCPVTELPGSNLSSECGIAANRGES